MTEEMVWDLSQLVQKTDPTSIQEKLIAMVAEAEKVRDAYHNNIKNLDADGVLKLLETKDTLFLKYEGAYRYCRLRYAADSTDEVAKKLNDTARRTFMEVEQALAFIDLELGNLLADKPSLVTNGVLTEYKHYLERILRSVPYMLSEIEERLIITKDKNGIDAWQMLQSDWLSTRTFKIKIKDELKTLPYGRIISLFQSPDRTLRRQANQIVYKQLGMDEIVWASAVRAVCEDHLQMCKLRKHPTPMTQSLIDNDVNQPIIESLMRTIRKNVKLYQKYLKLKAKLMGLDKLGNYDVVAPLPYAPKMDFAWGDARRENVEAYRNFDEEIGGWVDEMFEKRHIDGEVRKGKRSGAFCADWLTGKSAYILQSFNKKLGDVYTLAHELGHAIHTYLGSRAQKPSNLELGMCIAETASKFGELLMTEQLLSKAKTKEEKQAILATVLDKFGMTAFQVSARVLFEQSMYESVKRGEFLDGSTVAKLWVKARDTIYGDSVEWLDVMKWEWTMKPHYYFANFRFYNYPYVFGQLFVFALYRLYKEEGKAFAPKFRRLLAAGSSKSPQELAAEVGFKIDEKLWEKGMKQAEEFINLLEETL